MKKDSKTLFGFWMYLMSDFVLFATLFAVYAVLRSGVAGGPTGAQLFSGPYVLTETLVLLTSSFICGLALLAARDGKKARTIVLLVVTALLGGLFVTMEFSEFGRLIAAGHGPQQSAFLSSYFTLVGTHGLHIIVGLIWVLSLIAAIERRGFTQPNMRKLLLWSMFWHFLDLIWIFIFTVVYLMSIL